MRHALTRFRLLVLVLLVALLGAAAYEAGVALEWIPVGTEPGAGARYEGFVLLSALVAMLAAVIVSLVLAARQRRDVPASFLAAATAALMVAHSFTFDTYYLPTLTRYWDSGAFSHAWVLWLSLAAGLTSLLALARPLYGFMATALVIPLCLFTIVFAGFGK